MKRKYSTRAAVTALLLSAGLVVAGGLNAAADADPARTPPWATEDGQVDWSKMPAEISVVDSQGNIVKDANGKPKKVKMKDGNFGADNKADHDKETRKKDPAGVDETVVTVDPDDMITFGSK